MVPLPSPPEDRSKIWEWLKGFPDTEKEFRPKWLSTPWMTWKGKIVKGRWQYRYDFRWGDLIVECDGPQHRRQISNWTNPLWTQIRDKYKDRLAKKRGFRVLRLDQKGVLLDHVKWRELILAYGGRDRPSFAGSFSFQRILHVQTRTPASGDSSRGRSVEACLPLPRSEGDRARNPAHASEDNLHLSQTSARAPVHLQVSLRSEQRSVPNMSAHRSDLGSVHRDYSFLAHLEPNRSLSVYGQKRSSETPPRSDRESARSLHAQCKRRRVSKDSSSVFEAFIFSKERILHEVSSFELARKEP